jgi:hypothetical protein
VNPIHSSEDPSLRPELEWRDEASKRGDIAEHVDNLILEYLRAMRADMSSMKTDIRELKRRLGRVEAEIVGIRQDLLRRDEAGVQRDEVVADLGTRFDALVDRVERIERRLDLKDY